MKLLLSLFLFLIISSALNAQNERTTTCSKRTRQVNSHAKSATLSVAQISETEKYNVHYYALDLSMTNTATTLGGTVDIHAKANQSLDSALIELYNSLTISQIRVNGNPVSFSRNNTAIKIPVNASAGQAFILSVDYNGTPPTAASNPLGGSGMTNDSSPSWGNQVTWSLSEPFLAYEWWPCKQSLTDKADSCKVNITVPSSCKAGSNGVLQQVVDLGNGTSRYEWKHNHPIDYYLISVSVAEYVEYNVYANPTGAPAPILIQNYVYNNPNTLPYFQNDIDETADFIELFSDLFGLYPFYDEKYGHCMAPVSGGMEHQTMTTQGWFEKSLTAHELAHQWWGDNVTCASWTDIWLNEGFASYCEYLMKEHLYPSETTQHMLDVHTSVMSQPGGSVWVLDSLTDASIFSGRLVYDKGGAIIHTLRFLLNNDSLFYSSLQQFQVAYEGQAATATQFKNFMQNATGLNLDNFFNQWYYGQGYPTYSLEWNSSSNGNLYLHLTHTVSSVTSTFTNPLEVLVHRAGTSDTTIRLDVSSNSEYYTIGNIGSVTSNPEIDPNNWIINKTGTITQNNTLAVESMLEIQPEIQIFPNPTSDLVTIQSKENQTYELTITDMEGKVILQKNVLNSATVSLTDLKAGSYFFSFRLNGKTAYSTNIIKK